jgi:hypothetical protein
MPALASSPSSSSSSSSSSSPPRGSLLEAAAEIARDAFVAVSASAGVSNATGRVLGVDARGNKELAARAEDRRADARRIAASTATRSAASTSSATRLLTSGVAPTRDAARASSWTSRSLMRPPPLSPRVDARARVEGAASRTPARVARGVAERAPTTFRLAESASGAEDVARERQYASSSSRSRACSRRRWTSSAASRVSRSSSVSPSRGSHGARAMRPARFKQPRYSPRGKSFSPISLDGTRRISQALN